MDGHPEKPYDPRSEGPTKAQMAEHEFRMSQGARPTRAYSEDVSSGGVKHQLESLTDQLSKTYALFNELVSRIDPILMPEMDSPMNAPYSDQEKAMPVQSEFMLRADELHASVRRLQRRITDTLERVQL